MNMHFERDESGETLVYLVQNSKRMRFNYITLVKFLIDNQELEATTYSDGFSGEERDAVESMNKLLVEACRKRSASEGEKEF